ncbi:MAG: M48 family metallopeptidase [Magnetococcus sp. WYHC-3]
MTGASRHGSLLLPGGPLAYHWLPRRSRRRLTLRVHGGDGRVEVRTPWQTSRAQVEALLRSEESWIRHQQRQAALRQAARPPLVDGTALPHPDGPLRLTLRTTPQGSVRRVGDTLSTPLLPAPLLQPLLERWYRQEARRWLQARMDLWAARLGVDYARLFIKAQKTRWGSCSALGNINLNWKLIWFDAATVDYVLVHELSHRNHPDHSSAFWSHVAKYLPHWRQLKLSLGRTDHFPW